MSKSMLVTLPFVLLLLDYWPLGRWQKDITATSKNRFQIANRLVWEKTTFLFTDDYFKYYNICGAIRSRFSISVLFLYVFPTPSLLIVPILEKTFWPVDLSLIYLFCIFFSRYGKSLFPVSFLLVLPVMAISFIKKMPYLFVGWFWYLGTLFPVIGLVPTSALMADHYTYLPSIGIAVMLAWGIPSLIENEETRKKILFPAAIFVIGILVVLTWQQCGYWKNSIDLWNHAIKRNEE